MLDKLLPAIFVAAALAAFAHPGQAAAPQDLRDQANAFARDGNFREAAELLEKLALDAKSTDKDAADDAHQAMACYRRVNEAEKAAVLLERLVEARPGSWRILALSAQSDNDIPYRGRRHDERRELQRVKGIQAMLKAEPLLGNPDDPATPDEKTAFYQDFAELVARDRLGMYSWRLTALTDVTQLPADEDELPFYALARRHAPVDADGNPVYYAEPESWDAATNDGERWRWVLGRLAVSSPAGRGKADLAFGNFLLTQFGVQTMTMDSPMAQNADLAGESGPFAVRTLTEKETIARLATGLKRFSTPHEFDHIAVLRRATLAEDADVRASALAALAAVFENRQQYHKAVALWEQGIKEAAGFGGDAWGYEARLRAITGKNGVLEVGPVAPAGSRTTLSYLFRNGDTVTMIAKRLDERKLLGDIRALIKDGSESFFQDYAARDPQMLGRMVVEKDEGKYVAETTAEWEVKLEPLQDYYSRRATIELPFDKAGCYLVEARMQDGNTSRLVLWINDLALVRKNAGDRQLFFVADAASGELVPAAALSFLGYEMLYNQNNNRANIISSQFADRTDANGLLLVPGDRLNGKQWLIAAETDDGRMAYLGFDSIWSGYADDENPDVGTCFVITDRPAYRPEQEVQFKVWYGRASYGGRNPSVDGQPIKVTIHNPRGEVVYDKPLLTDAYGGAAGSITLGADAPLGAYYINTDLGGGLMFRLEEYKKPEFEVTLDTPDCAITLGDTAQLKIRASYYYGAPVANATVSYKIVRTTHRSAWQPPWRWDWLYGAGSWRSEYDYSWYPGYAGWGRPRIQPPWFYEQPEVVAEGEGTLDDDGVFRLNIDTAPAQQLLGDQDHAYAVTAEVTDQSRRTIVGSGKVVAARAPFSVALWTDRGYYPAGQRIGVSVRAMLPLGGGVKAKGEAVLYRIRYDRDGKPSETAVADKSIETGEDGNAETAFAVDEAGQYRVGVALRDAQGNAASSSTLVTVRGKAGEGDFRFSALELVPDSRDYKPGDTVKLAINSENKNATVLFFPRAERMNREGAMLPLLFRLENGSHIVDVPVGRADQPNFFCEAVTIYKGRMYVETREIFVPPADKTLKVEVEPDKQSYRPGEKAEFAVRVSDADGQPVTGQCVVSVYDRSVEYISGGSNVADIRSFFWSWKRHYSPMAFTSLSKSPYAPYRQGDVNWEPIGVFGAQEADWNDDTVHTNGRMLRGRSQGYMEAPRMMAKSMSADAVMAMPAPAAPMQAEADMAVGAVMMDQKAVTGGGGDDGGMAEATVRSEFADTALWIAALETDDDGKATFSLNMPENLTAWKARTWVMGEGVRVGEAEAGVETKKNVIIRPQAPRFLTQKDQVVLSANLHNYLPRAKAARAELVLEGGLLEAEAGESLVREVQLAANGEARVDWVVNARRPGSARVVMKLLTDEESDAAETIIPVVVHGARRVESFGGVLRDDRSEETIRFRVPEERLADQSRLEFSFSPSIASSMLEALPYLVEYPYGCTEQTLNRFLPVVTTRKFMDSIGANLGDAKRAIESQRDDAQSAAWRATWGDPRSGKKGSPVFDDAELDAMVKQGIERLAAMQNSDGGWGWFSGAGERSWPHTTAVVVHGLQAAVKNGAAIPMGVLDDGINWLRGYQQEQIARLKADPEDKDARPAAKARADNLDAFVYMILAEDGRRPLDPDMRDFLYQGRLQLSAGALAMFGLALHEEKATNALDMVVRNLSQYLKTDADIGTAWLDTPASGWWWWYNDPVETQAWYLKLLSRVDPKGDAASGVAKHLLRSRKNGSYWRSTRDTAYAIEALADYAVASGEAAPDMTVTLYLDGAPVMERRLTAADILVDNRFALEGVAVEAGEHELRLVRSGGGNLYYGGGLDVFSLEDPIRAAGLEIKVDRAFYRLHRDNADTPMPTSSGVAVTGKTERYRREALPGIDAGSLATVQSGDLIEVELTIDAKNDYEYLVFEDMKAAGLEAVELRSGYSVNSLGAYVEYRDQKVVLFIRYLPQGTYTISYRFRAEAPGSFSALPTFGGGMYATDLFANSDEMKIRIAEEGVYGE